MTGRRRALGGSGGRSWPAEPAVCDPTAATHARACGHLARSRLNSTGWRRARGRFHPITGQGPSGSRPRGQADQWDHERGTRAARLPDARRALRVRRRAAELRGPAACRGPGAALSGFHLDKLPPALTESSASEQRDGAVRKKQSLPLSNLLRLRWLAGRADLEKATKASPPRIRVQAALNWWPGGLDCVPDLAV